MERSVAPRDRITAALAAGAIAGIVMELVLYAGRLGGIPAQAVLGGPAWSAGGIALQLAIAIAWAYGYVSLARSQPQITRRPLISGVAFGIVVYTFMQILVIIDGGYHRPSGPTTMLTLAAYIVFYGVTVGAIVARMLRRA